jgi:hypothetical protein
MSHRLYSTVLSWNPTHGFAKMHGVMVVIGKPPELLGRSVAAIDYIPEIGRKTVMFTGERWRDMNGEEVLAADVLLAKLTI